MHRQPVEGKVKVYRFKRIGESATPPLYATQEAIERLDGTMIVGAAIEVDQSELTGDGRYYPVKIVKALRPE